MKQFIGQYLFYLLAIASALIAATCFALQGEWLALVWALLAGSYAGLFLRESIYLAREKKEFKKYILSHNK